MYCQNCGSVIGQNDRFCNSCGKPQPSLTTTGQVCAASRNCPKCGDSLNDSDAACPKCQRLSGRETPYMSIHKALGIWAVAIVLVLVIFGHRPRPSPRSEPESSPEELKKRIREWRDPTPLTSESDATPKQDPTPIGLPQLGRVIKVGYFAYVVNDVQWKTVLGDRGLVQERPDAAFLVVDITVINNADKPKYFESPQLVDSSGRTFTSTWNAAIAEGSKLVLKELNPGVGSSGEIVFDVPHGSYSLKLTDGEGLFHSSKTVPLVIYR